MRQSRDLLADEVHLIPPTVARGLRVALCYPNVYETGMCNLGFHSVYRQLTEHPQASCERVFFAENAEPRSLEGGRPLSAFDVIAFSITYEMDFFNLAEMLLRGGIPARREDRSGDDPLVLCGGTCAGQNPLPLTGLVDAFLLGDGEEGGPAIWDALTRLNRPACPRSEALEALAALPGCYVPAIHGTDDDIAIPRLTVVDLETHDTQSWILTPRTQFGKMWLVETTRGCAGGCKFCLVGFTQPRERQHSTDRILEALRTYRDLIPRVGFMGSSVCGHPRLLDLVEESVRMGKTVSISSMRADQLSPRLLEALARGGMKTMTLAPESGDEFSRQALNKKIADADFINLARVAGEVGIEVVKLYALVGAPDAPAHEVDAIADLAGRVREAFLSSRRPGPKMVTVGAAPFVPKPHTTYGTRAMASENDIGRDLKRLRSLLAQKKIRFTGHSAFEALTMGALSLSGPEASETILEVAANRSEWRRIIRNDLGGRLSDPRVLDGNRHPMPLRRNHPRRTLATA